MTEIGQVAMDQRYQKPLKISLLVCALIFLGGCENPYIKRLKTEFGWTEARMVSDGWLKGRRIESRKVYCYETLGDADCFLTPNKSEQHRQTVQIEPGDF
jgi:hypothetical protein